VLLKCWCIYLVVHVDNIALTGSDHHDISQIKQHMDPNVKLLPSHGEPLSDPAKYKILVEKLNHFIVTRPDISFGVSVMSQFFNSPCVDHWNAVIYILKYIKDSSRKCLLYGHNNHTRVVWYSNVDWERFLFGRRSTFEYCVSICDNLISWKIKKQNVATRSSAEAKYKVMTSATCEFIWLK